MTRTEALRARLLALGFDEVRFARVERMPPTRLREWLERGWQADMAWMERTADKRLDPQLVLSGAKSIVMLGVNYWRPEGREAVPAAPRGIWARYSLHDDYHDTIKPGLVGAGKALEELFSVRADDYRYSVDTGPVLERGWAAAAGLGFQGKNGMLISRRHGNWLFLASLLTRAELDPDEPLRKAPRSPVVPPAFSAERPEVGLLCGKCTRCQEACPTAALREPGLVDARLCISYQTIENRGPIPRELREGVGLRVFGCDICLEVCPWNRFAREGRRTLLAARGEIADLTLVELLELTPERFAAVFRRTGVKRLKLNGLLRNACVAAGNAPKAEGGDPLAEPLLALARRAAPLVRAHAVWALRRRLEPADERLRALRQNETDPLVLAEYA